MLQKQISNRVKIFTTTVMILILVFLIGCAGSGSYTSVFDKPLPPNISTGHPQFDVETVNIRNSDSTKTTILNIYIDIPFSELKFQKIKGNYYAIYDIELRINHENGNSEYKIFKVRTLPLSYKQVNNNTSKKFTYTIYYEGKPGAYILDIKVTDKVAQRSAFLQIPITITRLSSEFEISDLIFVKDLNVVANAKEFSELVPFNPFLLNSWIDPVLAFEIYYPNQIKTTPIPITIECELKKDNKVIRKNQLNAISVTSEKDIIGVKIHLPEDFNNGLYELALTVYIYNIETNEKEFTSRTVIKTVYFDSLVPRSISQMKEFVKPLELFIPGPYTMMKNFEKAQTAKEKADILFDFWKEQGHDVMEQFYARVKYANQRYGGWQTDMGKVFTKFGPPLGGIDKVNDWRYMPSTKYEVWHYTNYSAIHTFYFFLTGMKYDYKVFIFVDRFGMNDFDFGRGAEYNKIREHNFYEFNNEIKRW